MHERKCCRRHCCCHHFNDNDIYTRTHTHTSTNWNAMKEYSSESIRSIETHKDSERWRERKRAKASETKRNERRKVFVCEWKANAERNKYAHKYSITFVWRVHDIGHRRRRKLLWYFILFDASYFPKWFFTLLHYSLLFLSPIPNSIPRSIKILGLDQNCFLLFFMRW